MLTRTNHTLVLAAAAAVVAFSSPNAEAQIFLKNKDRVKCSGRPDYFSSARMDALDDYYGAGYGTATTSAAAASYHACGGVPLKRNQWSPWEFVDRKCGVEGSSVGLGAGRSPSRKKVSALALLPSNRYGVAMSSSVFGTNMVENNDGNTSPSDRRNQT